MRRPSLALVTGVLSLALVAPVSLGSPASAEPELPALPTQQADEPVEEPAEQPLEVARDALGAVEDLLATDDAGVGGKSGPGVEAPAPAEEGRELTLALRDLVLARGALSGEEAEQADAYLARPSDRGGAPFGVEYSVGEAPRTCGEDVCVHRVASTDDAATAAYAQRVLETAQGVHSTYVGAGYRAPKSDRAAANNGGNAKTDVYLADLGDAGVYGYCTSDQTGGAAVRDRWAYCVVDNDYSRAQYPRQTPLENMQVTVAHEYFHAVQFAYDIGEDAWLMEGTATWVEDQVYDAINDNLSYLDRGPIGTPGRSLDLDRAGLEVYGAWSFWRRLTERFPAAEGGLPTLVRDVWRQADSTTADGTYSLKALQRVLKTRGSNVRPQFADYVAANRFPAQRYEEGSSYPRSPVGDQVELSRREKTYTSRRRLDHLAGATVRLEPGAGTARRNRALRIGVDLPKSKRGSALRISVVDDSGTATTTAVSLNKKGNAQVRRPFSSRRVEAVEVHLVNASTRIQACGSGGAVSCQGFARDDRLRFTMNAKVVTR